MEEKKQLRKNADTNTYDLDAALEEKYREVQQDASRLRELNTKKQPPKSEDPIELPAQETPVSPDSKEESAMPAKEEAQQRRARHKKRRALLITTRIGEVLRIFTVGVIFFGCSIFLLVGSRPTESAEENRMLAEIPSFSFDTLADGTYIEDLMYYYEDTVPGRSFFKQLISDITLYKGLQEENNVTFIGNVSQITQEEDSSEATIETQPISTSTRTKQTTSVTDSTEITTTTTTEAEELVEVGDGVILVGTRAISVYGGSFSKGETYAASLNAYQADLGEDVNLYSLVAPTAVSFYLPDEYASYTASELDNIEHINEYLDDSILAVDAYHALEAHTEEDIYARTDHHWLPLGAYYAAQAFAEVADVPFADLSTYTATTKSGYVGSMYTFTKSAVLQDNPEDFTYYTPSNSYSTLYYDTDFTNEREGNLLISLDNVDPVSWYLVFMGGDERIAHVTTDTDNDRILVIVKDSYGNALVPFLTDSFSEIYVTDMRYFELNAISFMEQVGATDVLFAMNTFSATGSNCDYLETNRTQ